TLFRSAVEQLEADGGRQAIALGRFPEVASVDLDRLVAGQVLDVELRVGVRRDAELRPLELPHAHAAARPVAGVAAVGGIAALVREQPVDELAEGVGHGVRVACSSRSTRFSSASTFFTAMRSNRVLRSRTSLAMDPTARPSSSCLVRVACCSALISRSCQETSPTTLGDRNGIKITIVFTATFASLFSTASSACMSFPLIAPVRSDGNLLRRAPPAQRMQWPSAAALHRAGARGQLDQDRLGVGPGRLQDHAEADDVAGTGAGADHLAVADVPDGRGALGEGPAGGLGQFEDALD